MVDYVSIENTLNKLDGLYNSSLDTQMVILYSKLAVLELCGWIETSVDIVLFEYVDTHIVNIENKNKINGIIKKNHGFDYKSNIFPLFCSVIGINNLENILDKITDTDLQNLISLSDTYTQERNKAAHTDTPNGTTRTYSAPSNVIIDFRKIKNSIVVIESEIQRI